MTQTNGTAPRLGMLIDLSTCVGCNACAVACKMENDTPHNCFSTWVDSWDTGAYPEVYRANLPKLCNHCDNPACQTVCPTGATFTTDEGVVLVDPDRCIGCKYCMAACPYGARIQIKKTGVIEKCRFCWYEGEPGNPPRCVGTCISGARLFGDLDDPQSEICQEIARTNAQPLAGDLTTAKIYYVR